MRAARRGSSGTIHWSMRRLSYLAALMAIIAAGLSTRAHPWPDVVVAYGGDTLWASALYVGLRLLETHSRLGLFGVGTFVGFASFFGRNHALYAGLGILLLALWLHWKRREDRFFTRFATLGGGVLVGCFPLMGMMLWVPGFGESFLESVRFTLEHDANLPVPVPWPWQTDYTALSWQERTGSFALGSTFALAPLVYGLGLLTMLRTRTEQLQQRSALIAATAVGVFYLHHASVRSDALHLAQCVHPLLLAGLAIPAAFDLLRGRLPTLAIWSGIALLTVSFVPNYDATFPLRFQPRVTMVTQRIMGDELRLAWPRAKYLASIKEIVRRRVPEDETILIAPHMAALYPLLRKTSPVWGLAFLWEADAQGEGEIIRDLERKRVNWALVLDIPIDGRDELRFSQSHRRVWEYLTREFVRIEDPALPGMHVLFRRRPPGPGAEPW